MESKLFYVINRNMDVVTSMSNVTDGTMWIDDTNGGQELAITNGVVVGTYDFEVDAYADDSKYITPGNFIAFTDKYKKTRLYTIITVSGSDTLDVHCEDIGLDLINEMANADTNDEAQERTIEEYLNQVFANTSWVVQYDTDGISTQTRYLDLSSNTETMLSRLETIMTGFGFECDFEITIKNMMVNSMICHVYSKLQNRSETEISQRFIDSVNLVSLTRSASIADLYTAVRVTGGTVENKVIDISDIEYDDGQFWTTKGDNVLYDRKNAELYSRFAGTDRQSASDPKYIYGHYESSTESVGTLWEEGLADLKEHNTIKLSYEAELLDLDADLGDYVTIVELAKPDPVYLRARIQAVCNYYTTDKEDTGTLANYTLLSSTNGDNVRELLKKIEIKTAHIKDTRQYFTTGDNGSYPPDNAEWSDTKPSVEDVPYGKWLWVKQVITNTDDTQTITYSATKNIENYKATATIKDRQIEYYLNDGTEAPSDESVWSSEQPTVSDGKTYWTRDKVTWSDGTIEYTPAINANWMTDVQNKVNDNTSAAEIAHKQALSAQEAADKANDLAQQNFDKIDPIYNVVTIVTEPAEESGLKVSSAKDSKSYSLTRDDGLHLFVPTLDISTREYSSKEVARFTKDQTHVDNMAVSGFMMFGAHRAECVSIKDQNGSIINATAFYWIGDVL